VGDHAKHILSAMQSGPFALATDGSNDVRAVKLSLCVHYFDSGISEVMFCYVVIKRMHKDFHSRKHFQRP